MAVEDNFNGKLLSDRWQWSVFQNVASEVNKGELHIHGISSSTGAYLGTKIFTGNYNATTLIRTNKSSSIAGIGLIGDDKNAIMALYKDNTLQLSSLRDGKDTTLVVSKVMAKKKLYLRAEVTNNKDIQFLFSTDGKNYITLNDDPVDGSFLPPWDRAVRVGLISKGTTDQKAVFDSFEMKNR
jgi:hypothetical protein